MNVNHVDLQDRPQDLFAAIFNKQRDLMPKYHEIEKKNGLLQTEQMPFDINDKFCQARIKDFLWRTSEELSESLEHQIADFEPDEKFEGNTHNVEEIIDALHFHTENCIQCSIEYPDIAGETLEILCDEIRKEYISYDKWDLYLLAYTALGLTGNCLKNKPWKQDHKLTDLTKFYSKMITSYKYILAICIVGFGMSAEDIYDMYYKKNSVNIFRQRSGY